MVMILKQFYAIEKDRADLSPNSIWTLCQWNNISSKSINKKKNILLVRRNQVDYLVL